MLPQLREFERRFPDSLVVIGVHSAKFPAERDPENLRAAVLRHGATHPVVSDPDMAIWQSYGVRAWPSLMFVDPNGYVFAKHEGEFPLEPMAEAIGELVVQFEKDGFLVRSPLVLTPEAAPTSTLAFPGKVLADPARNRLFVADSGHHRILVTDLDGTVTHVIGSGQPGRADGDAATASFHGPQGLAITPDGDTLYVADTENHLLRLVDLGDESPWVSTVAGTGERGHRAVTGPAEETALASPWDLAWVGQTLWIANAGTHQLWAYDPASELLGVAAGTGYESIHDGPLDEATFAQPSGLSVLDGLVYVADSETSAVRRVDPAADRVQRLVGKGLFDFGDVDAKGDSAKLQHPIAVAATHENGVPVVYVADSYNDKVKRLDPATRMIETVFGGDGRGTADGFGLDAEFWEPCGLSIAGRTLYIADTNNHRVRAANLDTGEVTTLIS